MKKMMTSLIVLSILLLSILSCKKDELATTTANITLLENGVGKDGVTVYMFSDKRGPNTPFFKPLSASKGIITENGGVASFDLNKISDLEVIDKQTTLYFGVFDVNNNVLGKTAITIKKGETKNSTINISNNSGGGNTGGNTGGGTGQTPIAVKITQIKITKFPQRNSNGDYWDNSLGGYYPDIYFKIAEYGSNSSILYNHNQYIENVSSVPVSFTNLNIQLGLNYSSGIALWLYDYDATTTDDIMGGCGGFNFSEYAVTKPSYVDINCNNIAYRMYITWMY